MSRIQPSRGSSGIASKILAWMVAIPIILIGISLFLFLGTLIWTVVFHFVSWGFHEAFGYKMLTWPQCGMCAFVVSLVLGVLNGKSK